MSDTELQVEKQRVPDQRMRVLRQQGTVLSLHREGGERLEEAVGLLNSLRDELNRMESRLEQLIGLLIFMKLNVTTPMFL